ncbi:hypothetical protein ACDF64_10310 [Agromyces sp. MMS24-JH15]|uniref:hypothetical protein n=1 Tax=Agromyces sp. MMS24-JH15 TaxID=3243765 RepID=UPI003748EAFD
MTVVVGQAGTLNFSGFPPNTPSTATASDLVTLSVLRAATASKPTSATGTVSYTAVSNTPGTYTITVTAGQTVGVGTLTVVPADTAGGSTTPSTGFDLPVLWIWIAVGAIALGAALVIVLTTVRRSRKSE